MLKLMSESKDDGDALPVDGESGGKADDQKSEDAESPKETLGHDELFVEDGDEDPEDDLEFLELTLLGRIKGSLKTLIIITAGIVLVAGGAYFFLVEGEPVTEKEVVSAQNEVVKPGSEEESRGMQSGLGTVAEGAEGVSAPPPEEEEPAASPEPLSSQLEPVKLFIRSVRPPRARALLWVDGVRSGPLKKKRRTVVVREGEHRILVVYNHKGERVELEGQVVARPGEESVVVINFPKQTIEQQPRKRRRRKGR